MDDTPPFAESILEQIRDAVIYADALHAAMTTGATTLKGRPTLTRAAHQSGRTLYIEMTFALVKPPDASTWWARSPSHAT